MRRRYFALFLLALHQRVALERMATCSSRFKRLRLGHPVHSPDVVSKAMRVRELHDDLRDDLKELDELLERIEREARQAR